jgi:hypothetical protein
MSALQRNATMSIEILTCSAYLTVRNVGKKHLLPSHSSPGWDEMMDIFIKGIANYKEPWTQR